jgi:RNA polymerase sigma-70 factor, ECF subfamily
MGPATHDRPADDVLARGVAQADPRALAEIYRRYGGAVWGLARRVLRDDHLAEEVCQTVFTDLWSHPERFDPSRGSLRSWLLTQAHRRSVDLVRSEEARRRRDARDAREAPPAWVESEVEDMVAGLAVADEVRQALDNLPPDERDPIVLAYFGGQSYRQAAAQLGQPEGTVKSRIRAGLKRLRQELLAVGITGMSVGEA